MIIHVRHTVVCSSDAAKVEVLRVWVEPRRRRAGERLAVTLSETFVSVLRYLLRFLGGRTRRRIVAVLTLALAILLRTVELSVRGRRNATVMDGPSPYDTVDGDGDRLGLWESAETVVKADESGSSLLPADLDGARPNRPHCVMVMGALGYDQRQADERIERCEERLGILLREVVLDSERSQLALLPILDDTHLSGMPNCGNRYIC